MSTIKFEALTSKSSMDRKLILLHYADFISRLKSIFIDDRDTETSVLETHLSQSLFIIQGFALNHKPSKHFLGRRYALEASRCLISELPVETYSCHLIIGTAGFITCLPSFIIFNATHNHNSQYNNSSTWARRSIDAIVFRRSGHVIMRLSGFLAFSASFRGLRWCADCSQNSQDGRDTERSQVSGMLVT